MPGNGKIFLRVGFLNREAPRSEAFFTSAIQIVSGILYQDAAFSFCRAIDFFKKFLKKFFTAFPLPGDSGVISIPKTYRHREGKLDAIFNKGGILRR